MTGTTPGITRRALPGLALPLALPLAGPAAAQAPAHSPTTAPIGATAAATRRPEARPGRAAGTRMRHSAARREAPMVAARSSQPGSVRRSPS